MSDSNQEQPKYDQSRALELLGEVTERMNPDRRGATDAAERLLESLVEIGRKIRMARIERPSTPRTVVIILDRTYVWIKNESGTLEAAVGDASMPLYAMTAIPDLRYNPATTLLEGPEIVEGDEHRRKSAPEVVIEHALRSAKLRE